MYFEQILIAMFPLQPATLHLMGNLLVAQLTEPPARWHTHSAPVVTLWIVNKLDD